MLVLALGCSADPTGTLEDTSAPPAEDARCDVDGSLAVELPAEGALAVLDHAGDLAHELLGATPTWRGDLRGLELDERGVPLSDGEIPSAGGPEGPGSVPVGWQTTWCAGDREVRLTASATEAGAICRAADPPCVGQPPAARPPLDAAGAIAAVGASSWSWHAVLFQPSDGGPVPDTFAWHVVWFEETGQAFAFVDARTGAVLPCADGAQPGCRDLD